MGISKYTNKIGMGLAAGLIMLSLGCQDKGAEKQTLEQQVLSTDLPAKSQNKLENYPDPTYTKPDEFASDTQRMTLARAIFGEGVGELKNTDYIYGIVRAILNRAESKGKTVKETLLKNRTISTEHGTKTIYQFSCFDPNEGILDKLRNPLKYESEENWRKCYELAELALNGRLDGNPKLDKATNYFVGYDPSKYRKPAEAKRKKIPSWAYESNNGKIVLDKNGERLPREPLAAVPVRLTEKNPEIMAYFYSLEHF